MVDLNRYLKRFKEKAKLYDFPDEYIFYDKEMTKAFCDYLKYHLLNIYYYSAAE